MIKINKSLEEVVNEISELRHIEESSEKSNVNIRSRVRQIISKYWVEFSLNQEAEEYTFMYYFFL